MLGGREHQAGVDDDDAAVVLDDRHVLADLAQPAEREDAQSAAHAGTGRSDSTIRRTSASSCVVHLDQRQAHAADLEAEQVQRGLDGRGRSGR